MSKLNTHTNRSLLAVAVASVFGAGQSRAEALDDERLEVVNVVGRTTNTEITPLELEKQQANDLSDVFRHIPSVTVGGSLGFAQKVYIRGMEDTLLNITVDGAPQTGTLFHHVGRVSIEPELLQQVEVQSGAGEATSGPGAIGGAIRFKTKSARDLLDGDLPFGAILKANHFTNNGNKGSATLFGEIADSIGVLASYTYVDRGNMEDGEGNELFGTATDQSLGFFKLDSELAENQVLTLSYELREESGELGRRPNWPVLASDPLFDLEGERNTLVANYVANLSEALNFQVTLYDTQSELVQDGPFGLYGGKTQSIGFDIRNTSQFGRFGTTYGLEGRDDTVEAGPADEATRQSFSDDGLETFLSEDGEVLAAYVQNRWQVSEPLLISFGVRYDSYKLTQNNTGNEADSDGFSPNIGFSYDLSDELTLVVGHARALRGKEIGDSFTLDDSGIAPNIKAEKVQNNEIGLEYNGDVVAVNAALFQSTIDDVIFDQLGDSDGRGGPQPNYYFENIGEWETNGIELSTAFDLDNLYLAGSLSVADSEINGDIVNAYEYNGLGNTRGDTVVLEAEYTFSPHWEVGWNFTYVRKLRNIEVLQRAVELGWIDETQFITKPGYRIHDLYLRWTPLDSDTLSVNLGVQNVLNEQYLDHSSVGDYTAIPDWEIVSGVPEAGRDVRLTLSYRL